jgi:hypothetical protein
MILSTTYIHNMQFADFTNTFWHVYKYETLVTSQSDTSIP